MKLKPSLLLLTMAATLLASSLVIERCFATADVDVTLPATDDGLPGQGPIRRYDWFRALWQQKRTQFASEVSAKQKAVVFLGDSRIGFFLFGMLASWKGSGYRKRLAVMLGIQIQQEGDSTTSPVVGRRVGGSLGAEAGLEHLGVDHTGVDGYRGHC